MKLFLLTLFAFGIVLLGMSVGVIFGNRRIRGSCGGMSQLDGIQGKITCEACSPEGRHCSSHEGGQETNNSRHEKVDA